MDDQAIVEAIQRLLRIEKELKEARREAGMALRLASEKTNIADLHRRYGISRPKIYWLMNQVGEEGNNANLED